MNYEGITSYCRNIKKKTSSYIPLPASLFRSSIDETKRSIKRNPYTFNKNCIQYHKAVFFFLGFLFFTLSAILCFWKVNWICSLYFINGEIFKYALSIISFGLAVACFGCGLMLKVENELILKLYTRARKRLRRAYWRHLMESETVATHIKFKYKEMLESLNLCKEDALHIVKQISQSKTYDNISKERLYNQLISEFSTKLKTTIAQGF